MPDYANLDSLDDTQSNNNYKKISSKSSKHVRFTDQNETQILPSQSSTSFQSTISSQSGNNLPYHSSHDLNDDRSNTLLDTDHHDDLTPEEIADIEKEAKLREKARLLEHDKASWLGLFFLTWISPLVALGKYYNISFDDVPKGPAADTPAKTLPRLQEKWSNAVKKEQDEMFKNEIESQITKQIPPTLTTENRLGSYDEFVLQTEEIDSLRVYTLNDSKVENALPPAPASTPRVIPHQYTQEPSIPEEIIDTHPVTKALKRPKYSLLSEPEPKRPIVTFFSMFLTPFIKSGLGEIAYYCFALMQPYVIKKLSKYFQAFRDGDMAVATTWNGIYWASALGLVSILIAVTTLYRHNNQIYLSTRQTAATLSALFQKTLKIAPYSVTNDPKLSSGALTNLVSNDSMRINNTVVFIHFVWSGPIAILICLFLMYYDLGKASFVTLALMLLLVPYQLAMAEVQRYYRQKVLDLTDARLKFVSQLLSGIRIIKAYAWENVLAERLSEYRQVELQALKVEAFYGWLAEIITFIYPLLVTWLTLLAYVRWNGNNFNTETVFLILAYLNTMRLPISFLSSSIQAVMDQYVAHKRISHYLIKEEVPVTRAQFEQALGVSGVSKYHNNSHSSLQHNNNTTSPSTPPINLFPSQLASSDSSLLFSSSSNVNNSEILCELNNVDFYWSSLEQKPLQVPVLTNVSMRLRRGEVIGLISLSSKGKTALLNGILGNLYPQQVRQHSGLKNIPNPFKSSTALPGTNGDIYLQPNGQIAFPVNGRSDSNNNNHNNEVSIHHLSTQGNGSNSNGPNTATDNNIDNNNSGKKFLPPTTDHLFSYTNTINLIPSSLMQINGRCGYCQQHPWLMNDTIRNNITLGLPFDPIWFQVCVDASSLRPDLEILDQADLTIISEGGSNLSGGQQARLQFCRLLYLSDYVDFVILDDIFAAVDALVAKNMFYNGVCGILKAKNKGVIVSMNSHYDFIQDCDKIILLDTLQDQEELEYWSLLHQNVSKKYEAGMAELAAIQKNKDIAEINSHNPISLYKRMTHQYSDELIQDSRQVRKENKKKKHRRNDSEELDVLGDNSSKSSYANFNDDHIDITQNKNNSNNLNRLTPQPMKRNDSSSSSSSSSSIENDDHDNNDIITGFRPPSGIIFTGTFQQLQQLSHPLIDSITFSSLQGLQLQREQVLFDPIQRYKDVLYAVQHGIVDTDNTTGETLQGSSTNEDDGTTKKLKKKTIGEINALKEATQAAQLSQKIDTYSGEGDNDKKKSKTPTQAQLPNTLYLYYLQGSRGRIGLWLVIISLFVFSASSQGVRTYTDLWLVKWAEDASKTEPTQPNSYWLKSTAWGMFFSFLLYLAQVVIFIWAAIDASRFIHAESVKYIFRSTVAYLDATPVGTLLNNLGKDIEVLDDTLPNNLLYVIQQGFVLLGVIVLACVASPFFIIPLLPLCLVIWYLRTGYHNTSVQLKRLDSATLQPIYSLFSSVLKGGAVIRAYQLQDQFNNRFRKLVDDYTRVRVVAVQLERRFGAYINCLSACYTGVLALLVVLFRKHIDTNLGMLSVTYSLRLVALQVTIRFHTQVTQSITHVHRLHELRKVPQEPPFYTLPHIKNDIADKQPLIFRNYQLQEEKLFNEKNKSGKKIVPKTKDGHHINIDYRYEQQQSLYYWPWYGRIDFKNLTLKYKPELPIVINRLNFTVLPGQKVGVCGRTGAGKSTLMVTMARLLEAHSGCIEIDGVDISTLGVGDLRNRVSIIPQSPTLFEGTLRSNLDPLTRFTDEELWEALQLVSMDDKVKQLENGLYSIVHEMGGNFASSERQLFCIARALLSQPKVNNDGQTQGFGDSSVLGHRKHSKKTKKDNTTWSDNMNQINGNNDVNGSHQYEALPDSNSNKKDTNNHYHVNIQTTTNNGALLPPPPQGSILLADEITSSTDINADNVVQHTIRTAFVDATILIIAHRLSTIVDLDRVLVLRSLTPDDINNNVSSLLEYDVPFILLNNPNSTFYNMCKGLGFDNFLVLYEKSKQAFYVTQQKEYTKWGTMLKYPDIEIIHQPGFKEDFFESTDNTNNDDDGACDDDDGDIVHSTTTSAKISTLTATGNNGVNNKKHDDGNYDDGDDDDDNNDELLFQHIKSTTTNDNVHYHHTNPPQQTPQQSNVIQHLDTLGFNYDDTAMLIEESLKSPDAFSTHNTAKQPQKFKTQETPTISTVFVDTNYQQNEMILSPASPQQQQQTIKNTPHHNSQESDQSDGQ